MFYSGSISPPRSPALKKFKPNPRRKPEKKMGDGALPSAMSGV